MGSRNFRAEISSIGGIVVLIIGIANTAMQWWWFSASVPAVVTTGMPFAKHAGMCGENRLE
jgi:hypothetical protein